MVILAGKLPWVRSYSVLVYSSGNPMYVPFNATAHHLLYVPVCLGGRCNVTAPVARPALEGKTGRAGMRGLGPPSSRGKVEGQKQSSFTLCVYTHTVIHIHCVYIHKLSYIYTLCICAHIVWPMSVCVCNWVFVCIGTKSLIQNVWSFCFSSCEIFMNTEA